MERAIEWYLAVTLVIVGLSHVMRAEDWTEAYRQLGAMGHPGVFVNGGMSLVSGTVIIAGHGSWAWPGAILTGFGWLLVGKGCLCFLAPHRAMRSMALASPKGFVIGGIVFIAMGGWACYCLWHHTQGR